MFTEELSELVSWASTTESLRVCVCVCVCAFGLVLKNWVCPCVCVCVSYGAKEREREREREGEWVKGREGRRDEEKREKGCYSSLTLAKVSLSLRCLMTLFGFFAQERRPAQTSYSPHLPTHVDSTARLSRLFRSRTELYNQPHSWWGKVYGVLTEVTGVFPVTHFTVTDIRSYQSDPVSERK